MSTTTSRTGGGGEAESSTSKSTSTSTSTSHTEPPAPTTRPSPNLSNFPPLSLSPSFPNSTTITSTLTIFPTFTTLLTTTSPTTTNIISTTTLLPPSPTLIPNPAATSAFAAQSSLLTTTSTLLHKNFITTTILSSLTLFFLLLLSIIILILYLRRRRNHSSNLNSNSKSKNTNTDDSPPLTSLTPFFPTIPPPPHLNTEIRETSLSMGPRGGTADSYSRALAQTQIRTEASLASAPPNLPLSGGGRGRNRSFSAPTSAPEMAPRIPEFVGLGSPDMRRGLGIEASPGSSVGRGQIAGRNEGFAQAGQRPGTGNLFEQGGQGNIDLVSPGRSTSRSPGGGTDGQGREKTEDEDVWPAPLILSSPQTPQSVRVRSNERVMRRPVGSSSGGSGIRGFALGPGPVVRPSALVLRDAGSRLRGIGGVGQNAGDNSKREGGLLYHETLSSGAERQREEDQQLQQVDRGEMIISRVMQPLPATLTSNLPVPAEEERSSIYSVASDGYPHGVGGGDGGGLVVPREERQGRVLDTRASSGVFPEGREGS